ncbi:MAG: glycosyltransferase family 4 protein [Candidatus Altiarchaeota archaeon]
MNILLLSCALNYRFFKRIFKEGHSITLLTPKRERSNLERELARLGSERGNITVKYLPFPFIFFLNIATSFELFKGGIDVILTNSPVYAFTVSGIKTVFRKKLVMFVWQPYTSYFSLNHPGLRWLTPIYNIICHIAFRIANRVICLSAFLEIYVRSHGAKSTKICHYYGVDTNIFKPLKTKGNGKFNILAVGRFTAEKGHHVLLEACSSLKKSFDFEIIIVGFGPLKDELKRRGEDLGLNLKLRDYMETKKLVELYNQADVFIQPSIEEGLGFTAAEALSCEVPVIASNVGGLPDIVGGYGVLVKPGDVSELSSAISEVRANLKGYQKKAGRGRKHIQEKFDESKTGDEFLKLLKTAYWD